MVLFSTSGCDRKSVLRDDPSAETQKLAFLKQPTDFEMIIL